MTCKDHQEPLFDGPSCGARPCFAACPPELQQALQAQAMQTPHIPEDPQVFVEILYICDLMSFDDI